MRSDWKGWCWEAQGGNGTTPPSCNHLITALAGSIKVAELDADLISSHCGTGAADLVPDGWLVLFDDGNCSDGKVQANE